MLHQLYSNRTLLRRMAAQDHFEQQDPGRAYRRDGRCGIVVEGIHQPGKNLVSLSHYKDGCKYARIARARSVATNFPCLSA